MNSIKIKSLFVLTFFLVFSSSLSGATNKEPKKKVICISAENRSLLYKEIVEDFLTILNNSPRCENQKTEALALIKNTKRFSLLDDLFSYQTLTGNTLLHLALEKKHIDIALLLIENSNQENLLISNKQGKLAIHLAVALNNPDIITALHEKEQNGFFIKDKKGRIPLHYAVEKNAFLILELMISFAPETINLRDIDGNTPVHLCKTAEMLTIFSNYAADFAIENNEGISVQEMLINSHGSHKDKKNFLDYLPLWIRKDI